MGAVKVKENKRSVVLAVLFLYIQYSLLPAALPLPLKPKLPLK